MAIQVFGQGAVQTAYVSYLPLDITANSLTLVWPTSYIDVPFTQDGIHYQAIAASMQVTTGAGNTHTITLPNATQTTVGANFIMTNIGQSAFTLNKSDGTPLIVLPETALSNSFWVQLTDNSTAAGEWSVIGFGAGTYIAQAAALAGYGLVADNRNKLNTQIPVVQIAAPPVLVEADNANLFIWTGAANTINLPLVADVPSGYYLSFNNNGSGPIIIRPSENPLGTKKIDGEDSLTLGTGQTVTIITDGSNWWSLGLGFTVANNFTTSPDVPVPAGGDYTLSPVQSAFDAINFTGTLTSNLTVHLDNLERSWFLSNSTTGNFTLSIQLSNIGLSYVLPQGSARQYIQGFFSNGLTLCPLLTSVQSFQVQGQVLVPNGSTAAPTYSFTNYPSSGIYHSSSSDIIRVSINNQITSEFKKTGTQGGVTAVSSGGKDIQLVADDTLGGIVYNGIPAIGIGLTGNIVLSSPLPINSGGSNAITKAQAAINILPTTAVAGTMIYFDGTNWVVLPIGTAGQVLTVVAGVPAWA